jgi:WD40 repeat protein
LAHSSWDDSTIWLRDAATARATGRLVGSESAEALAFDPKGDRLATATARFPPGRAIHAVQLWDVARHERQGAEPLASGPGGGRFGAVPQMSFSPDGRTLAVVGIDKVPLFFDVDEATWPAVACRIAGRDLSPSEWRRFVGPGFDYEPTCPKG